jgi:hypothetical protein
VLLTMQCSATLLQRVKQTRRGKKIAAESRYSISLKAYSIQALFSLRATLCKLGVAAMTTFKKRVSFVLRISQHMLPKVRDERLLGTSNYCTPFMPNASQASLMHL